MLRKKEEKVVSTVHLYRRQLRRIDLLARQTGHARARVLREVVDAGLAALREGASAHRGPASALRQQAFECLLRMSEGYGASSGSGIHWLDEELYGRP